MSDASQPFHLSACLSWAAVGSPARRSAVLAAFLLLFAGCASTSVEQATAAGQDDAASPGAASEAPAETAGEPADMAAEDAQGAGAQSLQEMVTAAMGSEEEADDEGPSLPMRTGPEPTPKSLEKAVEEARAQPRGDDWQTEAAARRLRREPPGGEWFQDEKGRVYFLSPYPKGAEWAPYRGQWAETVRMVQLGRDGDVYEVAGEDDEALYLVVFRPPVKYADPEEIRREREEMERLRASYVVTTPEVDHITLVPYSRGLPQRGQWRNGFDLADMDGDGRLDIVHGPPRRLMTNLPIIFRNLGDGSWETMQVRYPRFPYDYGDAAAADFNGDGTPDIALGIHLRGVTALVAEDGSGEGEEYRLYNDGLEFFSPMPGDDVGSDAAVFSSRTLTTADWNGDGRPDIVAVGEGPRPATDIIQRTQRLFERTSYGLRVYINEGEGRWRALELPREERRVYGDSVATGDFDGDGEMEAFMGNAVINIRTLLVDNAGSLLELVEVPEVRNMAIVHGVASGDFDGDGRDDVALTYLNREPDIWRSGIDVLYSREDGWERRPLFMREGRYPFTALATGDLDGDGAVDLVALDRKGTTYAFLGDGGGFFAQETSLGIEPPDIDCAGYHVALGDLDGDGRDEIVESFAGEADALFAPERCRSGGALRAWDVRVGP